jgi:crotonobetainyl-CoA:carnitine CoA-transferase CaiB-like acyl-CoA transferase
MNQEARMVGTDGPLAHYKVVDLTSEEGQFCGRMLAGLGADVIKIEPPGGDPVRHIGPWYHGQESPETSLRWFALNVGKRSVTLDLDSDRGRDLLLRLTETADAIIESFPPGHLDELGLGYAVLRSRNPRLVLTSISAYGQDGPYRDRPWADITVLAMSGLLSLSGDPDRPPLRMSTPQSFFHACMQATIGTLLALYARAESGEGQHVDVSAQEALTMSLEGPGPVVNAWRMAGEVQRRQGRYREPAPGFRFPVVLPCKDGYIAVASILGAALPTWLAALEEDGMAGDLGDERWRTASFAGTVQPGQWVPSPADMDHVYEIVTAWTRSHTKAELAEAARRHQFLAGSQNTVVDILESEQLRARRFFQAVEHPELGGSITYPGAPFRMSRTPWRSGPRPPLLGEHTTEVLTDVAIGENLADLRRESVL